MEKLSSGNRFLLSAFVVFFTSIAICSFIASHQNCDPIIMRSSPSGITPMPLVYDSNPYTASERYYAPVEQRGPEFRRYLAPSLKIRVSGASGSGTIVYFDESTGWAYVASCGHLWSGSRSAQELRRRPVSAKVITWYHNEKKLSSPKEYPAEVLFWSNKRGYDSSCLRFRPDWVPDYFPIAGKDYKMNAGDRLHSVGCDGGREVAHYDVEFVEYRGGDLITKRNSPRPGRSGGGLLSSDGWYVATCWGTSSFDGGGIGYFTPLSAIYSIFSDNGYDWLLEVGQGSIAQRIPIRDWMSPKRDFERDYIPIPGNRRQRIPFNALLNR